MCEAMRDEDFTPELIGGAGAARGTGAAPLEFVDHVGTPLAEGPRIVRNALVATQDPERTRALVVGEEALRVQRSQRAAVASARRARPPRESRTPAQPRPDMLRKRLDPHTVRSCAELSPYLQPGRKLDPGSATTPGDWLPGRYAADPDTFTV
ncbi:hypothetical protein FHX42_001514 [Saccharopolyspora lacisalsi]|uniref:Uncharacterized protein n=1 Tax=Halosaccharopolyspora lacisalsi TaxID=1000566 RepID=A0A839DXU1_9PSEU|nr:hypothetical protein [Halosaccharopolyspora lacisalsi]MBA8824185.1 hypothetical protein [Halosaccharopolyspora lacisalsi]